MTLSAQDMLELSRGEQYYVPLKGHEDQTAEDVYEYGRSNANMFTQIDQKAKGRTSEAEDSFAMLILMLKQPLSYQTRTT